MADSRREQAIQAELDRIASGLAPTRTAVERAPYLADWSWCPHPVYGVPVLCGYVYGHQRLGNGLIYTGRVWAMAIDRRWALTTSRYYRLGPVAQRL